MFNDYYFKREQYQDIIRESGKERIIRQIQKSNRDRDRKSPRERRRERTSWIEKIGWAIKEAGQISAH